MRHDEMMAALNGIGERGAVELVRDGGEVLTVVNTPLHDGSTIITTMGVLLHYSRMTWYECDDDETRIEGLSEDGERVTIAPAEWSLAEASA